MGKRCKSYAVHLTLIIFLVIKSYDNCAPKAPPVEPPKIPSTEPQCEIQEEKDCKIINEEICPKEEGNRCSPHPQKASCQVSKPKERECPVSCKEIKDTKSESVDGLYRVWPTYLDHTVVVYCDMTTSGGGWTVFQRRTEKVKDHVNFDRNWNEYKEGFGNLHGEFWLGNEYISAISNEYDSELFIEMTDFKNRTAFARYFFFRVLPEVEEYKMEVLNYTGNATDQLVYNKNQPFRTRDRNANRCTTKYHYNGWWFNIGYGTPYCFWGNLNGPHSEKIIYSDSFARIVWHAFSMSLKRTEMKIRSKNKYN